MRSPPGVRFLERACEQLLRFVGAFQVVRMVAAELAEVRLNLPARVFRREEVSV
jgi:hypothetical protein